jgi:hypothetical protein
MTALAVALVIAASVAALAYAAPKMYWYVQQVSLLRQANKAEEEKLAVFSEAVKKNETVNVTTDPSAGLYL